MQSADCGCGYRIRPPEKTEIEKLSDEVKGLKDLVKILVDQTAVSPSIVKSSPFLGTTYD